VSATWYAGGILYFVSGAGKLLTSPAWRAGEALGCILTSTVTRPLAAEVLEALPRWVLRDATWGTLAIELGFLPLALWPRARLWLWLASTTMHGIILVTLDVTQVSLAMLLFHGLLALAFVRGPPAKGNLVLQGPANATGSRPARDNRQIHLAAGSTPTRSQAPA
jgi:hypothetical protein